MHKLICGLFGLFVAASVEASCEGDLRAALSADSLQSFCCEAKSVEKQSAIASETSFSLPEIAKCRKSHLESGLEKVELHSGCNFLSVRRTSADCRRGCSVVMCKCGR